MSDVACQMGHVNMQENRWNVVNLQNRKLLKLIESGSNRGAGLLSEIIWLTVLTLGSMILFSLVGVPLTVALYKVNYSSLLSSDYANATDQVIRALKFLNFITTLGTFLVPVIALPYLMRQKPVEYLSLNKPLKPLAVLQVVVIFLLIFPFLDWLVNFNNNLHLPESMAATDQWIRAKETQMQSLTQAFLQMDSFDDMLANLLLVAFIPALLEELYFRGLVQNLVHKWFGNTHAAVIFTAIFFSAVHLQFLGFIPRFLLGFLFGYLFFWTGSIWTTVFAHFLNNAIAVVLVYLGQNGVINYQMDQPMNSSNMTVIVSIALTATFFFALAVYYNRKRDKTKDWVKVFTSYTVAEAEIVKGRLDAAGIEVVMMNKKDSTYLTFGSVELYVKPEEEQRALQIVNSEEETTEEDTETNKEQA